MKVLMVGPSLDAKGGISSVVNQYIYAGIDKSVEFHYLPTTKQGNKLFKSLFFIKCILKAYIIMNKFDIVHIHVSKDGSCFRKRIIAHIAKQFKKKIIFHIHSSQFIEFYQKSSNINKRKIKNMFNISDKIIVLSNYWKNEFSFLISKEKLIALNNGVKLPDSFKKDYKNKNILFLGKVCKEKGILELLYAMVEIVKIYPDIVLYVGGIGEISIYKKISEELNISKNVRFLGWIYGSDKEKYLKKCSIFVLPSYFEGMPVSLLEAMSYSCACVCTSVGGVPEVLNHGKNGLLINPKNIFELQSMLLACIDDETQRNNLGKNALETITKEYNIKIILEDLKNIYLEVFNK